MREVGGRGEGGGGCGEKRCEVAGEAGGRARVGCEPEERGGGR